MEYHRKRGRRGRGSYANMQIPISPTLSAQSSFADSFTSFLILSSLVGIIYLMLDHHCSTCSAKCDTSNITKSIEQIAKNISAMKNNYNDLEMKILHFSQKLPVVESQIEKLEALATSIRHKELSDWNPKPDSPLPNIDKFQKGADHFETKLKSKSIY